MTMSDENVENSEQIAQLEKAVISLAVIVAQALGRESKLLRDLLEGAGAAEFQRLNEAGDHQAAAIVFQLLRELHGQNNPPLHDRT
jgi:hypothetical protein